MIIVKNRELLIPGNERYLGTTYDNISENRVFLIPRFSQNGTDLSALNFRLDFLYANGSHQYDTITLVKTVNDEYITLTWPIREEILQVPGTVIVQIRAIDTENTVKWSTFQAAFYVERHLNTPGNYSGSLTEIRQMESDHEYMKGVINELKASLDYTSDAEAWAVGTRKHVDDETGAVTHPAVGEDDETYHNNSKYHAEMALYRANQAGSSANAAAASATQAAETVADTNARFENAVSAVTVNTEVQDARVGADGIQYTVLKNRLDAEHTQLKSAIDAFAFEGKYYANIAWEDGNIFDGSSEATSSTRKRTKNFISFSPAQTVKITVPSGKRIYGWYYPAPDYADRTSLPGAWHTTDFELTVDASKYYKFIISDNPEGSTRVSESGFAFELEPTVYHQLDRKIDEVGGTLDSLFADGNNLFDPDTAVEKHALSTTGVSTSNNAYWHTDYIDCDGIDILLFPPNSRVLRFCWYSAKSESSFVSYAQGVEYVKKPSTARYIRIAFYNANTAFADRYGIMIVGYGKNPAFETHEVLNPKEMTVRDGQYFFVDRGDYSTSFDIVINRGDQGNKNMIVSFHGHYTGTAAPTISFAYPLRYDTTNMYFTSQTYTMGNALFPDVQEWRLPAFPLQATAMRATVTIPSGTTLHIEHLYNKYDDAINRNVGSYKLSAHLGTPCIYPNNTMLSFNSAAKLGYPGCVTVPKRTSDGVWVCFHDDSNVGNTLRNPDGSNLSSADAAKSISDFTYAELLAFSAGAKKSMYYAGEKVPTLEAFFALCQRTGMAPILSTHPNPDASGWAEIKELTDKYNVTDKLVIKGGSIVSCLAVAHEVFGDEIDAYIVDVSDSTRDAVTELDALGWTLNHARLGIEYFNAIITQAKVTEALTAGYAVACFIQYGTAARYKELLAMGVTEITDDNNCSFGLNW